MVWHADRQLDGQRDVRMAGRGADAQPCERVDQLDDERRVGVRPLLRAAVVQRLGDALVHRARVEPQREDVHAAQARVGRNRQRGKVRELRLALPGVDAVCGGELLLARPLPPSN